MNVETGSRRCDTPHWKFVDYTCQMQIQVMSPYQPHTSTLRISDDISVISPWLIASRWLVRSGRMSSTPIFCFSLVNEHTAGRRIDRQPGF